MKHIQKGSTYVACADVLSAIRRYPLVGLLGWQDVRQRYRRSALGPFWLTISMGVMIATIGIVFGQIFKSPMAEYLPFVSVGLIVWTYVSSVIMEGCNGFIASESIIKQLPIPLYVHILRMMWRNTIILAHNIVIVPLVLLAVGKPIGMTTFLSIPGFLLLALNLGWISLLLALLCARYRDLPQIITSLLQIVFYLTPIMWMPHLLPQRAGLFLLDLNPVYHLLEVCRTPILGQIPSTTNWIVSAGMAIIGWIASLMIYGRFKHRIPYWL